MSNPTSHRALVVLVLVFAAASAPAVTVPNPLFEAKKPIVAADVNANFKALVDAVTALEKQRPVVTYNGKSYSLDALYCGASSPALGNLGGYSGAKATCESTCKSSTAHMCTVAEMQRSASLGKNASASDGWVAGATGHVGNGWATSAVMTDCLGWTSSSGSGSGTFGTTWHGASGIYYPSPAPCWSNAIPVFCCD